MSTLYFFCPSRRRHTRYHLRDQKTAPARECSLQFAAPRLLCSGSPFAGPQKEDCTNRPLDRTAESPETETGYSVQLRTATASSVQLAERLKPGVIPGGSGIAGLCPGAGCLRCGDGC